MHMLYMHYSGNDTMECLATVMYLSALVLLAVGSEE